jgi:hypothetical protein
LQSQIEGLSLTHREIDPKNECRFSTSQSWFLSL